MSEGSSFSISSLAFICLFDYSHPNEYEMVSHVVFICISLMADDVGHLICLLAIIYFLWRSINSDPLLIFLIELSYY